MSLVLFVLENVLRGVLSPTLRLPLAIVTGVAVYLLLGWLIMPAALRELFLVFRPK